MMQMRMFITLGEIERLMWVIHHHGSQDKVGKTLKKWHQASNMMVQALPIHHK